MLREVDGLFCLKQIPNCDTYATATAQTLKSTCNVCKVEYFLDNGATTDYSTNSCVTSIPNCKTYEAGNRNKCTSCKNQFYLDTSNYSCQNQLYIATCLLYDDVKRNICKLCISPQYPFLK